MELTEGVHALPLSFDRGDHEMTVYAAAVETRRGAILVDAGLPGSRDQIEDRLAAAGIPLPDVHDLLLTHRDADHVGGASELLAVDTDIDVVAHREATPHIEGEDGDGGSDPVGVDLQVVDGVRFATQAGPMAVVHTPGHTPGHVSLHFPDAGLLLAADAVVADGDRIAGPSETHSADVATALDSVQRLGDLAVEETLCYHGGHVEQGSDRLAAIAESGETA